MFHFPGNDLIFDAYEQLEKHRSEGHHPSLSGAFYLFQLTAFFQQL